ncbi:MAG TPA: DUF4097 family beta strand repeat-containing protein [Thermoanaerobaculia bacterium]|nr:DUF4097 family beta strand repeat-containing protein [Thermoanaerobaculia bacterium]
MRKLAFAATLLFVAAAAGAATLEETVDRTLNVQPGATVSLTNVNGRVTIKSWDQPRVHIVAEKEVEGSRDDAQEVMKALRVDIVPQNGGVSVTTHHPRRGDDGVGGFFDWLLGNHVQAQVRYELTIPRNMNLDVRTVNGSIHLADVNGHLELDTTNGKIEVERCSGSIDASTTNGGIRAHLVQVAKGQPMRFETTNGRIELEVPPSLAADIEAGTTNGSISTDLPVATTHFKRNSLRGTINGGGPSIRLRTTNGGIAIKTRT